MAKKSLNDVYSMYSSMDLNLADTFKTLWYPQTVLVTDLAFAAPWKRAF